MSSPMTSATRVQEILQAGQSIWLDFIQRGLITSGALAQMVRNDWITGLTSNPTIFERAISGSADYDHALRLIAAREPTSSYEAFLELATDDIRAAADILRPIYEATSARDGYVSLEVPPSLGRDYPATVTEGLRLFGLVDRPNVMIKVPGTTEGARAAADLIAAGVNVNVTLLFSVGQYEEAAQAYIEGLERRLAAGAHVDRVASVASFFVSRVDTAVDALLPPGSPLRGRAAVANARLAYRRFLENFAGDRWSRLADGGAMVQRPLWASTGTKNAEYSDVFYVDDLIGPDTVNTMPEATLRAVLDHGSAEPALFTGMAEAAVEMRAIAAAGIDFPTVTARLLEDGLKSFASDFERLLDRIESILASLRNATRMATASLETLQAYTTPERGVPR